MRLCGVCVTYCVLMYGFICGGVDVSLLCVLFCVVLYDLLMLVLVCGCVIVLTCACVVYL